MGDRSRERGPQLWAKIPEVYPQQATGSPALSAVSPGVIPPTQPKAMPQQARKTTAVARFTNPLRPRLSRLGREARSFAQNLAHHVGASKFFICHDNLEKAAALPM